LGKINSLLDVEYHEVQLTLQQRCIFVFLPVLNLYIRRNTDRLLIRGGGVEGITAAVVRVNKNDIINNAMCSAAIEKQQQSLVNTMWPQQWEF